MKKQAGIRYPVRWDHDFFESIAEQSRHVFPRVVELIEEVAAINGQSDYINQEIEADLGLVLVAHTDRGAAKFRRRYRRAIVLANKVKLANRRLVRAEAARIIRQNASGRHREIVIEWRTQTKAVAAQLKALNRALQSKSPYRIEAAWFGITPHAHEYLAVGYEIARRARKLRRFCGELDVKAKLIQVRIPSPELLRLYVPDAVRAAALPGRRPSHPRDEALAALLSIYNEASGSSTGSARLGGYDEPTGPGADFVRSVEKLFGIQLLALSSTHAIARAKQRMASVTKP
jgi:hypothetical protein